MVAVVHLVQARAHRVEFAHPHARLAQPVEIRARRGDRADAVVEELHLDALGGPVLKHRQQPLAGLAVVQDVGLEVDVVARLRHGGEHGVVRAGAVDQQPRFVALDQRRGRQVAAAGGKLLRRKRRAAGQDGGQQRGEQVTA